MAKDTITQLLEKVASGKVSVKDARVALEDASLTEEQISTILYIMEGYIVNSDDTNDEQFNEDVDNIFEKLETAVDIHYAELDALTNINPEPFITGFHD